MGREPCALGKEVKRDKVRRARIVDMLHALARDFRDQLMMMIKNGRESPCPAACCPSFNPVSLHGANNR
jgi:hypothetical protein